MFLLEIMLRYLSYLLYDPIPSIARICLCCPHPRLVDLGINIYRRPSNLYTYPSSSIRKSAIAILCAGGS